MEKSTTSSRRSKALLFLKKFCDQNVVEHSLMVSKIARDIAERIRNNDYDIDPDFVEIAAILHDIGRSKTHGIRHGIEGSRILRDSEFSEFASICERHIGAGISRDEAPSIGLPEQDYIPETLEEKVIAHADNITLGVKKVPIQKILERLGKELGKTHPALKRVSDLNNFIERLAG